MRTAVYSILFSFLLASCNNHKTAESSAVVQSKTLVTLPSPPEQLKGTYIGDFKGSPIAITLNYVSSTHASGYNVHKGLTRNISGTIEPASSGFLRLQLSEPGNNQYDGKFDLLVDTAKLIGKGTWAPFKKGEPTDFSFKKKQATEEEWELIFTDSLQNDITLKPDGSCTYKYLADTTNTAQELTIRGNYTREKNTYTIYWQKNNVFPQKSVFKLIESKPYKDEDYVEKSLKGEGRLFTQMWD